jgi:hypothetical protein
VARQEVGPGLDVVEEVLVGVALQRLLDLGLVPGVLGEECQMSGARPTYPATARAA